MRIFFIIFIFITAFSLYPKVAPLFLSSDSSISTTNSFTFAQNNRQKDKRIIPDTKVTTNTQSNANKNPVSMNIRHKYIKHRYYHKKLPKYKDGQYKGRLADAYYGYVQVKLIINNDKISDIKFLRFPNSNGNSEYLSNMALPSLKKEVIRAQSGSVDTISGATYTSLAFMKSTKSALTKALN